MSEQQTVTKKRIVNGSIRPRWPKKRVVRWLVIGAFPVLIGLWVTGWISGFLTEVPGSRWLDLPGLPPLLTYAGALILFKGCYEGIKRMGIHYILLVVFILLCLASAATSVLFSVFGHPASVLVSSFLALSFGGAVLNVTVAKVAEMTQESRIARVSAAILVLNAFSLLLGFAGAFQLAGPGPSAASLLLHGSNAAYTLTFLLCCLGVYYYHAQTSLGAGFAESPERQYWVGQR